MMVALRAGDEVDLVVSWGSQNRNKCPHCHRYLTRGERLSCRCGAEYRRRPSGLYRVARAPR